MNLYIYRRMNIGHELPRAPLHHVIHRTVEMCADLLNSLLYIIPKYIHG